MNVIRIEDYLAPSPSPAAEPSAPPKATEEGRERLEKALIGLHKAAIKQRTRVWKFQRTISDLAEKIQCLEHNCERFDRNMRRIRISPLRRAAVNLAGTMGSYLSGQAAR